MTVPRTLTAAAFLAFLALLALLALLTALPSGAVVKASPNPCSVVTPSMVTKALGGSAAGKLSSASAGGGHKLSICTYQKGAATLRLEVGPKAVAFGGSGGPPGTITKKSAAFGPYGMIFYDINPQYVYATVTFVKGAYYGGVFGGKLHLSSVLPLAKAYYAGLK
jgi:hypothetical protein